MSRMLREEDVLEAMEPDHFFTRDHYHALAEKIRALPAADDPRAEAAERLALAVREALDVLNIQPDLVRTDTGERGDGELNELCAHLDEALAAWREAGK